MSRMTQIGRIGVSLSIVFGLSVAVAQDVPHGSGNQRPAGEPPTTKPAEGTESEDPFERLQKMREKMEREAAAGEAAGEATPKPSTTSKATPKRTTRKRTVPPVRRPSQRRSIEDLRKRARASTQPETESKKTPREAASTEGVPGDFIGPPLELSRVGMSPEELAEADAAEAREAKAAEPPKKEEPAGELVRRPAREEEQWFNYVEMPWEDVIMDFVRRIGKPLMDPEDMLMMIGGTLTYQTDRTFTKDEAIDELNLIMHEKGYRFVEQPNHIRIIPVNEMKIWIEPIDTYASLEAFVQANPRSMDFVVVYIRVEDQAAQMFVDMFSDALPDYALLSALDDSNQIKIIALARDIREFVTLMGMIDISPSDPRELKFFKIETNARQIEALVRDFLDLGGTKTTLERDKRGRLVPKRTGGDQQSKVQMTADDRTNQLIVKATKDKMEDIEELIGQFDVKPEGLDFETEVVKVVHVGATEVANLMNQIFQQEQGAGGSPAWQRQRQAQEARRRAAAASVDRLILVDAVDVLLGDQPGLERP